MIFEEYKSSKASGTAFMLAQYKAFFYWLKFLTKPLGKMELLDFLNINSLDFPNTPRTFVPVTL